MSIFFFFQCIISVQVCTRKVEDIGCVSFQKQYSPTFETFLNISILRDLQCLPREPLYAPIQARDSINFMPLPSPQRQRGQSSSHDRRQRWAPVNMQYYTRVYALAPSANEFTRLFTVPRAKRPLLRLKTGNRRVLISIILHIRGVVQWENNIAARFLYNGIYMLDVLLFVLEFPIPAKTSIQSVINL